MQKAEYAGSVLAILKTFGIDDIANRLMGANGIHHLSNIMTLSMMVHRNFDALEIWLEETENATPHEVNAFVYSLFSYLIHFSVQGMCS
jgi:hypothetical protein